MQRFALVLLVLLLTLNAAAEFADYVFVPPSATKATEDPIPRADVAALLERDYPVAVYDGFAGQTERLKAYADKQGPFQVAAGFDVQLEANDLVGSPFSMAGIRVALGAVRSVEARAIRLLVDLLGFEATDELWVIDPSGPRAFGPFTGDDAEGDGTWLPTIQGDTAVLMLRSPGGTVPPLRVMTVSHFFTAVPTLKYDLCPIPAACESDTTVQEVSTGIGRIVLPAAGGGQFLCSGALVNNATTAEHEPLFIFANHCVDGINVVASGIEVFWDYRSSACSADSMTTTPSLTEVPRSMGALILAEDSTIDGELIELRHVPVGTLGRAWLGWDTRTPVADDRVMGIHHPQGTDMKLAAGHVTDVDQSYTASRTYEHVTRVLWDEGVTEGGSSGSPLLYRDFNYRILGMLSGGAVHHCATPETNFDFFSSFRHFFSLYGGFLKDGPTTEQMASVLVSNWDDMDTNVDGELSFEESTANLSSMTNALFQALDLNGNGGISLSEAQGVPDPGGPDCHAGANPRAPRTDWAVLLLAVAALTFASYRRTASRADAR